VRYALLLLVAACNPTLYAMSTPPPGRVGWLDTKERTLEMSNGVAIAFACEKWDGGPCRGATAASADPAIADVVPAHLARLDARLDNTDVSMVPATSFLVVGHKPGKVTIHVRSDDGDRELEVTVLPEPSRAAAVASH